MGDVKPIDSTFEETTIKNDNDNNVPVVKVVLELKSPVESVIYDYITYVESKHTSVSEVIVKSIDIGKKAINLIPLYDFYAAAGTFSEMQSEKNYSLIELQDNIKFNKDYFACKVIGDSMDRIIPNGSICLFKPYNGGSRNGKIVLVENMDIQDPDFNSAFTIKTYASEKSVSEDTWGHETIVLMPNSYDRSYKNIIITEDNSSGMRVVAEFVKIL
jgi:SOS-response transcriptional repressor LexA